MKPGAPILLNGHAWLGRLGHVSRHTVPIVGLVVLLGAALVLTRAALAARASLAFDPRLYREAAVRLQARADALARALEPAAADALLARYARPKPPPPPVPVVVARAPVAPDPAAQLRSWRLRGVMQQAGHPVAVLNDQLVAVGDRIQGFTLVAIAETFVDVRDMEGRLHRLDLYDHLPGGKKQMAP